MSKIVDMWIANLRFNGKSENSITAYKCDIAKLIKFLEDRNMNIDDNIKELDFDLLNEFRMSLVESAPRTVNRRVACLKSFFKFAKANKFVLENEAKDLENVSVVKKEAEFLNRKETNKVLEAVAQEKERKLGEKCHDYLVKRDELLIAMMLNTGLRSSEIRNIEINNIGYDEEDNMMVISILGKGKKYRNIFITERIMNIFNDYLDARKAHFEKFNIQSNLLFVTYRGNILGSNTLNDISKKAVADANINKNIHSHSLRHSYASNGIAEGKSIAAISKSLGHKNTEITLSIYTHANDSDVKEVMK